MRVALSGGAPEGRPPRSRPPFLPRRKGAPGAGREGNSQVPLGQQDLAKPPEPIHAPPKTRCRRVDVGPPPNLSGSVRFLVRTCAVISRRNSQAIKGLRRKGRCVPQ